jgi:cytochrome c5
MFRKTTLKRMAGLGCAIALATLGGCSSPETTQGPEAAARAAAMRPADARLAELYERSCKACHGVAGSGAPLAGDRQAWRPRVAKGGAALRASVSGGFKGMPAGGQCFTCTPQDYQALISFMADQSVD